MRTAIKAAFGLILGITVVVLAWLAAYDLLVFQPYMSTARKIIASAHADERNPPLALLRVLNVDFPDNLHWPASRLLEEAIDERALTEKQHGSLTRRLMFGLLVNLHLSRAEQTTLFLSQSYMGNGVRGFAAASPFVVGASLGSVSIEQAALLEATAWAPSASRERRVKRADVLIGRTRNAL